MLSQRGIRIETREVANVFRKGGKLLFKQSRCLSKRKTFVANFRRLSTCTVVGV
jgi:hypothetical protein